MSYYKKLIKKLKELDTDKSKCFWCGMELSEKNRTRDHFFPASGRIKGVINNKVYSCDLCNRVKKDLLPEDFEKTPHFKIWCRSNSTPYNIYKKLLIKKRSYGVPKR